MNETLTCATTVADIRAALAPLRLAGKRIACVPTMGALHEGHLTLVDVAHKHADVVVATIFVNPLQFGVNEDLTKYPRTLEADLAALEARGVSLVFTPSNEEMYDPDHEIRVTASSHDTKFEGKVRPGHFTGVLTVVAKLFNIIQPDVAVFGQKDLQQLSLVRKMVKDLNFPIEIIGVPTVRESDGLAMSSRNRYLSPEERQRATRLSQALFAIKAAFDRGERNTERLLTVGTAVLAEDPDIVLDYLELVDPDRFTGVEQASTGTAAIIAARIGSTRLLDNQIL
jgi:pantoate--beta-alanine ligase